MNGRLEENSELAWGREGSGKRRSSPLGTKEREVDQKKIKKILRENPKKLAPVETVGRKAGRT